MTSILPNEITIYVEHCNDTGNKIPYVAIVFTFFQGYIFYILRDMLISGGLKCSLSFIRKMALVAPHCF